jgi:hypothetical protein
VFWKYCDLLLFNYFHNTKTFKPLQGLHFVGVVRMRAPGRLLLHRQAVAFPVQQKTHKKSDERLKSNKRTAHYQQLFLLHHTSTSNCKQWEDCYGAIVQCIKQQTGILISETTYQMRLETCITRRPRYPCHQTACM